MRGLSDKEPIKVLFVEDDRKESYLVRSMLSEAEDTDFDVKWVQQLSTCFDSLDEEEFDVLLFDLSISDSEGPETLAKVCEKAPKTPVVALTDDGEEGSEALAQGAQDYVMKAQITSSVLTHSLTHAVARSRMVKGARYTDRYIRALLENAPVGILLLDAAGTMIYYSPSMTHILGYDEGENIGTSVFEFVHPDDVPETVRAFTQLMTKEGATDTVELRAKHKDGSWHPSEVMGVNYLHDPEVGGVVVNFIDITERRKAEEAFRYRARFHERLADQSPDALMVVDANGTIMFQSSSTERVFGFNPGEIEGKIGFDWVHPDDLTPIMEIFTDTILEPDSIADAECRFKQGDGTWHHAQATASNRLADPAVKGIVVSIRDITERRVMEVALKESEDELKQAMDKLRLLLEEVSTPVVQIWERILALPLIGVIDDHRAEQIMEVLLGKIVETQSELVIIDLTGVPSLDTHALHHLMQTIQATSMLGAQCVLTGMKPNLAQSVIQLDLDLSNLIIKRDMEEGLRWALNRMGHQSTSEPSSSKANE
jgi:rsbT co-antagonist protein RsbR